MPIWLVWIDKKRVSPFAETLPGLLHISAYDVVLVDPLLAHDIPQWRGWWLDAPEFRELRHGAALHVRCNLVPYICVSRKREFTFRELIVVWYLAAWLGSGDDVPRHLRCIAIMQHSGLSLTSLAELSSTSMPLHSSSIAKHQRSYKEPIWKFLPRSNNIFATAGLCVSESLIRILRLCQPCGGRKLFMEYSNVFFRSHVIMRSAYIPLSSLCLTLHSILSLSESLHTFSSRPPTPVHR